MIPLRRNSTPAAVWNWRKRRPRPLPGSGGQGRSGCRLVRLCETLAEVRPADALSSCKLARDTGEAAAETSQRRAGAISIMRPAMSYAATLSAMLSRRGRNWRAADGPRFQSMRRRRVACGGSAEPPAAAGLTESHLRRREPSMLLSCVCHSVGMAPGGQLMVAAHWPETPKARTKRRG